MFNVLLRKCVHSHSTIINFQVGNYESAHYSRETPLYALIEGVCTSTIYVYAKSTSVERGGGFSAKYAKTRKPTGREIDIYRRRFLTLCRDVHMNLFYCNTFNLV